MENKLIQSLGVYMSELWASGPQFIRFNGSFRNLTNKAFVVKSMLYNDQIYLKKAGIDRYPYPRTAGGTQAYWNAAITLTMPNAGTAAPFNSFLDNVGAAPAFEITKVFVLTGGNLYRPEIIIQPDDTISWQVHVMYNSLNGALTDNVEYAAYIDFEIEYLY